MQNLATPAVANGYEQRQQARRERLEAAAERARAESDRAFRRGDLREEVSGIPLGQPILVGHHSERRHRRAIERADLAIRAGIEAGKRAQELAYKAAAVGTAGISSDDPDAIAKLTAQVTDLEAKQLRMKQANATIRKHAKAGKDAQIAALVAIGYSEGAAGRLIEPDCCRRIGFPDYALQNNNANIRRIKGRIADLQQRAKHEADTGPAEPAEFGNGITVRTEDNRTQVTFPGKPADDIRTDLKRHGFKWSPTRGAWVRMASSTAQYHAERIAVRAANPGALA
jgi:hypothetical protein